MKFKLIAVCLAGLVVLWVSIPGLLLAQDENGLAGLAAQVRDLAERVAFLEAIWSGPGALDLGNGLCEIAFHGTAQDSTVLKYKETFDDWPDMDYLQIAGVAYVQETGEVLIRYEHLYDDQFVVERWQACEFLESSDWWEE